MALVWHALLVDILIMSAISCGKRTLLSQHGTLQALCTQPCFLDADDLAACSPAAVYCAAESHQRQ